MTHAIEYEPDRIGCETIARKPSNPRRVGDGLRSRPTRDGQEINVVPVVDRFSRYASVLDPRFSCQPRMWSGRGIGLPWIGYPKTISVDHRSRKKSRPMAISF